MKMLKYLYVIFLMALFVSCSNEPDINGFYVGIKENQSSNNHDLIFFKKDSLIDYFPGLNDDCSYSNRGDIFSFECRYGEDFKSRININDDTVTFYPLESDSDGFSYRRSLASNYLFDYPYEKLKIQLPKGKGEIKTVGRSFEFDNPLYLYKSDEGELMVNFMNHTCALNEEFYKVIGDLRKSGSRKSSSICIMGEKTLSMLEMKLLFDQLKLSGRIKVDYLFEHSKYDEVNLISDFITPLTHEEFMKFSHLNIPPPPPTPPRTSTEELKKSGVLFDFSNKTKESLEQFKKEFETRMKTDSNTVVIYYLAANSTYQDYISFLVTAKSTCLDLRDEYLTNKYEKTYRELMVSMNEKDMIIEARKKYPYRIIEIDSTELKEIKKDL